MADTNAAAESAAEMTIEENQGAPDEVSAETLMDNLTQEPDAQQAEPEQPAQEEPEQDPEKARRDALNAGLNSLMEEGVTRDELLAFSQDTGAREDIKKGKDVVRAFMAYMRRQTAAQKAAPEAQSKKSVPTVTTHSTKSAAQKRTIDQMTDAEFEAFSKKAEEALLAGKRVTF